MSSLFPGSQILPRPPSLKTTSRLPWSTSHLALPFPLGSGLVLFGYNRCSQPSADSLYTFMLILSSCLRGMVSSLQN